MRSPRHDRGRDQRPVLARLLQEHLYLLAGEPHPLRLGLLQLLNLGLDRVVRDQLVAERRIENLPEPRQRLVDSSVGKRALDQSLLALTHLGRLVAVYFLRGDL